MQEAFDWQETMEMTRRSAAAASQNSEHTLAGMSKLLREADRLSLKISSLTTEVEKIEAGHAQQTLACKALLKRAQGDNRASPRLLALGFLAAFAVGVGFGGFIVS